MLDATNQSTNAIDLKIAILVSTYHNEITLKLAQGALLAFLDAGGIEDNCKTIEVAGAWELAIVAKNIAQHGDVDAIVALGCIIKGETTHDNIIAHAITSGLMQTALEWGHPVSMGILTCQTIDQAKARAGGNCGNKGIEAMNAAINAEEIIREQYAKK
jgi:6,7-dimethyl-8-ribityllumazine synthase